MMTTSDDIIAPESDVVAQHQFFGMQLEIRLALEILDREAPHIVSNERDRHDDRHQGGSVVVEEGKHEELIQRKDSLYKELWEKQVGGFIR